MPTNNIIYKVRRFLEEKGTAETFRYIKSLDTIELVGISDNGKERVLANDIMREYGEETVCNNDGFKYLFPCIPEGVVKSRTNDGVIYYTHFKVINITEQKFGLEIKEYHFCDSNFYLRYIITVKGINNTVEEDSLDEIEVRYACVKQFLLETFSRQELKPYFSEMDIEWIEETANNDDAGLKSAVDIIIQYVLTTFQAINFLFNYKKKFSEQTGRKGSTTVINQEGNYIYANKERIIDTSKYYSLKLGKKNQKSTEKVRKNIIRRTDKWIVCGHMRHYKSGKVIFVQSYYKGPNKELSVKPKTTFIVKDTSIEI